MDQATQDLLARTEPPHRPNGERKLAHNVFMQVTWGLLGVAALGQLQGDASGSFDKHMPAQHLGAATAVEAEPPVVTAAQGQGPKRIVSGSDQQPAAATSVRSGGPASK